jgi:hypothetical protein
MHCFAGRTAFATIRIRACRLDGSVLPSVLRCHPPTRSPKLHSIRPTYVCYLERAVSLSKAQVGSPAAPMLMATTAALSRPCRDAPHRCEVASGSV